MSRWTSALPLLLTLACSRPDPGFDGIGPWHIGKTTMKEAGVRCDPPAASDPDLHWCYLNPDLTFAEQHASADLYFRGPDDSAKLAEILLVISRCNVEGIDKALTTKLGPAPERHGTTFVWKQPTASIVARMPSAPGECEISFLGPGETRRLAALIRRGEGGAAAAPPAPAPPPAAAP
jgi:hypothetical protein